MLLGLIRNPKTNLAEIWTRSPPRASRDPGKGSFGLPGVSKAGCSTKPSAIIGFDFRVLDDTVPSLDVAHHLPRSIHQPAPVPRRILPTSERHAGCGGVTRAPLVDEHLHGFRARVDDRSDLFGSALRGFRSSAIEQVKSGDSEESPLASIGAGPARSIESAVVHEHEAATAPVRHVEDQLVVAQIAGQDPLALEHCSGQ